MDTKQLYFRFVSFSSHQKTQQSKEVQGNETLQQELDSVNKNFALTATDTNHIVQKEWNENDDSQLWYLSPNFTHQCQSGFSIINKKTGQAIKYCGHNKQVQMAENQFGNEDFVWQIQSYALHQWQIFFQDSDYCLTVQDQYNADGATVVCQQNKDNDNQEFVMTLSEIDQMQETQQTHVSVGI